MSLFQSMREQGIWRGYSRHVASLNPTLEHMAARGMPVDPAVFDAVVAKLQGDFDSAKAEMQRIVPFEVKTKKVYKRKPKNPEGCMEVNGQWVRALPWSPSNKGLIAYIKHRGHVVPKNFKTGKETTQVLEVKRLSRTTGDPLYAIVITYRKAQTILKNHVKNWKPGPDHRVHTTFYYDPATGQLSSRRPNVQNAPKHDDPEFGGYAKTFRSMIKADPGHTIIECVSPETKILRHNLTWDTAKNIKIGDNLWGFDEELVSHGKRKGRYLRESFVTNVSNIRRPCVRITTNKGVITCATNHMMLARKGRRCGQGWRTAESIKPGYRIAHFITPWNTETSWAAGWIAGVLDGEGYGGNTNHRGLSFGQNEGDVATQFVLNAKELGFNFEQYETNRPCKYFSLRNKEAFSWLRAIGTFRPFRLYTRALKNMENMAYWGRNSSPAVVLSVEAVGEQEVIAIETNTHTYCAEGMISHNCDYKAFHIQTAGFEARDANMMRLGRLDIHSYIAANFLKLPGAQYLHEVKDDAELAELLAAVKKAHKFVRDNQAKRAILGYINGLGYTKLYDLNKEFFQSKWQAKSLMEMLDVLFPPSAAWRKAIVQKAHEQGYLISRHGYIRYFWEVFRWQGGKWAHGDDHEAALSFLIQNDAHGEIKDRIITIAERGLDEKYGLINTIHDSLIFHCPTHLVLDCKGEIKDIMEAPSTVLIDPIVAPNGLSVEVDVQAGPTWAEIKGS